jgi:hypothetical protein
MDVVINSQIQSPLVRTLARTKGKSQSFTHSIADNVPPCSFTKIQIGAQNATEKQYGRTYKLKIPQYGYLRDVILKYTTKENTVSDKIVKIIDPLYQFNYISLDDIRAAGTHNLASNPNTGLDGTATVLSATSTMTPTGGVDFSWYTLQNNVLGVNAGDAAAASANNGLWSYNFGYNTALEVKNVLAPQFAKLIPCSGTGAITNGNRFSESIPPSKTLTANNILTSLVTAGSMCKANNAYASSMSQLMRINGDPKLWSAILRFYMNIYANSKKGDAISTMVWEQLRSEPVQTISKKLYTSNASVTATLFTQQKTLTNGVQENTSGYTVSSNELSVEVDCTLPRYVVARRKGGEILWVPKIPQLRFDGNGTVVGVDFIPLDFIHPNDDDDTFSKLKQVNLSASDPRYNFRSYAFGDDDTVDEDWNMWDWQTESFYYQGLAANVAERVQLSTHNRPIQTVFPQEVYTRIQKLEPAERARYLKMMKARVSKSGYLADDAGTTGYAGEKSMYFPLFLSSTENPSLNFDTRFIEQLDIDVITRPITDVFAAADVVQQNTDPSTLYAWVDLYRTTVFGGDYGTVSSWAATSAQDFTQTTSALLSALAVPKAITASASSWETYNALTPRSYVIDLRSFTTVPANEIVVEALLYFHNFHDTTAQAIRDSNFKPGTPASLLSYNTYLETPIQLKKETLQNTSKINCLLTTNNLVFGTTFFVRRRGGVPKKSNKRDHNMQTLPIKSAVLTASGQQLYASTLDEAQITDPFDYELASGKIGRKYNNSLISQAIDDPYTGESFFMYHIPFGFSSDMTYNSGSVAFQTLNNPVLTVEVDVGKEASQPIDVVVNDDEFELVVLHNYWQMIRIDSNTGAITRSLDL